MTARVAVPHDDCELPPKGKPASELLRGGLLLIGSGLKGLFIGPAASLSHLRRGVLYWHQPRRKPGRSMLMPTNDGLYHINLADATPSVALRQRRANRHAELAR